MPLVRRAVLSDRCEIARLAGISGAADRLPSLLSDPFRCILVAEVGHRIVGMAEAQFYGVTLRREFGIARLHDLVVDERVRRRGIGSALLDAVEAWAVAMEQCRYLEWQSSPSAVSFYQSRGLTANEFEDSGDYPYFVVDIAGRRGRRVPGE